MNKKILHIIIGLEVGGAELMLKRLVLSSHLDMGYEHCIISLTDIGTIGYELQKQNIKVYSIGMKSLKSLPITIYRLRSMIKKVQPDIVQTWMYHADFLGGLAAKSLGIKNIIWGIRTTDISQGASSMTVYLSKICAKLSYYIPNTIVCAAQVSRSYHASIGYDQSKMLVIPNGFLFQDIKPTEQDSRDLRKEINLLDSDIVVGSVGRFNHVKNQKLFVDMAAEVSKYYPNVKFIMVGRGNNYRNQDLLSWIEQYDLVDSFRLLGQRSDVPTCLKAMDIFCLHSKTEGFPNVLVEAMACGVACVATDVGDVSHILEGFDHIVQPNDAYALSNRVKECIESIISHNQNYSSSLLMNSVYERYSMEKVKNMYYRLWSG